jgi:hypothetical protein
MLHQHLFKQDQNTRVINTATVSLPLAYLLQQHGRCMQPQTHQNMWLFGYCSLTAQSRDIFVTPSALPPVLYCVHCLLTSCTERVLFISPPQFDHQNKMRCGIYISSVMLSEDKCANANCDTCAVEGTEKS